MKVKKITVICLISVDIFGHVTLISWFSSLKMSLICNVNEAFVGICPPPSMNNWLCGDGYKALLVVLRPILRAESKSQVNPPDTRHI